MNSLSSSGSGRDIEAEALSRAYDLLLEAGRRRRARLAAEAEQERAEEQRPLSAGTVVEPGHESNRAPTYQP